ncbi:hypothetical protein J2W42_006736 [Rhizobium tibeticum]|uniref:hypothetical protein n=1 Tax=Rhizobium tibeticum TaxID=501024 RepID=UPI0027884E7D|nr:hypothetical protein [Rhizobium tibeticum]MDP9813860.1 hypothetical protein [Rhizobium tibeticum]
MLVDLDPRAVPDVSGMLELENEVRFGLQDRLIHNGGNADSWAAKRVEKAKLLHHRSLLCVVIQTERKWRLFRFLYQNGECDVSNCMEELGSKANGGSREKARRIAMSENEVVVRSGRKIAVGSEYWEIRDGGAPVEYVDIITELRHHNGVVYVSLGSAIVDANNFPLVAIAGRYRMDIGTAQSLHTLLGDLLAGMLKPVDQPKAH